MHPDWQWLGALKDCTLWPDEKPIVAYKYYYMHVSNCLRSSISFTFNIPEEKQNEQHYIGPNHRHAVCVPNTIPFRVCFGPLADIPHQLDTHSLTAYIYSRAKLGRAWDWDIYMPVYIGQTIYEAVLINTKATWV